MHGGEKDTLSNDIKSLAKARKKEAKLLKQCQASLSKWKEAEKAQWLYLSSLSALQAAMLEANARRPLSHRLSVRQIIDQSKHYKVLKELDESVQVSLIPKTSGDGLRPICDFGPVARGAQRMVLTVLRAAYTPAPFQYTTKGVAPALSEALRLIMEEGYTHVAELDIVSHFPSFKEASLLKTLPLPKSAIREIVLAKSAEFNMKGVYPLYKGPLFEQVTSGIPQGSASSSVLAEWSVSHLVWQNTKAPLINYADNFFVFAKSQKQLDDILEALSSAIAGLPGGPFETKLRKTRNVHDGFPILGCSISLAGCELTETNLQRLRELFDLELADARQLLHRSKAEVSDGLRKEGVEKFCALRNYAVSWVAAYSFCIDIPTIRDDLNYSLHEVAAIYGITDAELKAVESPFVHRSIRARS